MEVNKLNLKDIEKRLQSIVKDNTLKLRKGYEIEDTIKILEFILIEIAKSNDALGNVSYLKEYYSELFEDNRYSLFIFETNCNELDRMIENHRDMFALFFKDFIDEIITNNDFDRIFEDDLPYLHKITRILREDEEEIADLNDITNYLEEWLNIISYDESEGKFLDLLNDEFKDYYNSKLDD